MAKYLLDTHTIIWMQDDSSQISPRLKQLLSAPGAELIISIATMWEIVIKTQLGKLDIGVDLKELYRYCTQNKILINPIAINYLNAYSTLPLFHRDPFDRMIIATAISDEIPIVTKDADISKYPVSIIW